MKSVNITQPLINIYLYILYIIVVDVGYPFLKVIMTIEPIIVLFMAG